MKRLMMIILWSGMTANLIMVNGCTTEKGYWDPATNDIKSVLEYQKLSPEEQAKYKPVQLEFVKPEIVAKVGEGLATSKAVVQVVRPWIPEPFATGGVGLINGLILIWSLAKNKRLKNVYERVKLGALITAETVDKVVRPVADTWKMFTKEQDKKKLENASAIMPDEVAKEAA